MLRTGPGRDPGDEAESKILGAHIHFDGRSQETYRRKKARRRRLVLPAASQRAPSRGVAADRIGRVLHAVDRRRLRHNTIVVFTSDNGGERFSDTWPFTGKKTELLEGGIRIPTIVRGSGHVRAGSTSTQVGMMLDWLPTLLGFARVEPAGSHPPDGINLSSFITSDRAPVSRTLLWRYRRNSQRAVRDGNMKWLKMGPNTFLFNVEVDPLERANLKERQPKVFERLARMWDAWNTTMLPEDPGTLSQGYSGSRLADHYTPDTK